jgi:hypothetical protein
MFTLNNEVNINPRKVFRTIGYAQDSKPSARIASLVNEYTENVHHIIEPTVSHVIKDVNFIVGKHIVLESNIVITSKIMAKVMESASRIVIFTLTIGDPLEGITSQLAEDGLMSQASVLDAIGSTAAENVAISFEEKIRNMADSQGMEISRRFSPGYCDWDVSQQKMLFQALDGDQAGIHLTDSYLMIPRKSISGIIGIGTVGTMNHNPCKSCEQSTCVGRR